MQEDTAKTQDLLVTGYCPECRKAISFDIPDDGGEAYRRHCPECNALVTVFYDPDLRDWQIAKRA